MADILDSISEWLLGTEGGSRPPVKNPIINTDKNKIVKIIGELEKRHSAAIPVQDIVKKAQAELGFDEEKTRRIVNELVRDGYLTRPRWMDDIVRLHGVTDYCPWSEDFPS